MGINNIFYNSFYENEALVKWNFDVALIFHDSKADDNSTNEDQISKNMMYSELLSKAVKDIKLPELRAEQLETYLPGFHFAFPGKPGLNGEIQIKFADDLELTIRKIANYLLQYNYNPRYQQHEYFSEGTDNYLSIAHTVLGDVGNSLIISPKFDIMVRLYNAANSFVYKVIFKNCFVKSVGGISLDYEGTDVVETTATISYPYFKMLPPEDRDNNFDEYFELVKEESDS